MTVFVLHMALLTPMSTRPVTTPLFSSTLSEPSLYWTFAKSFVTSHLCGLIVVTEGCWCYFVISWYLFFIKKISDALTVMPTQVKLRQWCVKYKLSAEIIFLLMWVNYYCFFLIVFPIVICQSEFWVNSQWSKLHFTFRCNTTVVGWKYSGNTAVYLCMPWQ